MAILRFSLTPVATVRIYELLVCLAKFGETVAIEARSDKLTLTTLNLSKTAHASFSLDAKDFFISYTPGRSVAQRNGEKFTCQILNRALQSVFKGRTNDFRGRDASIERCDVSIQEEPDKTECRLVVHMICRHGMTKTYRLTYESGDVMHALFDKKAASQGWKISARVLREYIEFFGPKTEQLDLVASDGRAIFTSFTEKIQDGKEVLKHPLETAISIHTEDFEDFHVQEDMHVVLSVRDFKAIVTHAETVKGTISAQFSFPSRPLQFNYSVSGVHAEFTLMTTGDLRHTSATPNPKFVSTRAPPSQASTIAAPEPTNIVTEMPPPSRPFARKPLGSQKLQPATEVAQQPARESAEISSESLFIPEGNDDGSWDPPNYDNEEEEEMLGWDTSLDTSSASFHPTFRDSGTVAKPRKQPSAPAALEDEGLAPTQRLSQLHGMFD